MKTYDAIFFDMDGVLVDVAMSYWQTIIKTVELVLENTYGMQKEVTTDAIKLIKKIPGFNNDWDASFALIDLFVKGVPEALFRKEAKHVTGEVRQTKLYREVKDIFQVLYLGRKKGEGLIMKETLLLKKNSIADIANRYILAVATSRPRFEALFTLARLGVVPDLIKEDFIIAQEDTPAEKPDPSSLLMAKKKTGAKNPLYVGDTINDVIASRNAGMQSVYVGEEAWGDFQITNVNLLPLLLTKL